MANLLLADEPAQFAAAVGRVLDDASLAARLVEERRALVNARYSWDAAARRLEEFLCEVLAPSAAPSSPSTGPRSAQG
jgi:glycosyltransferase involved in cell wall biosynthesis